MNTFFMVWRDNGDAPVYRHASLESAKAEAERLAGLHGGQFHVLQSVGTARRSIVEWSSHEDPNDRPF